MNTFLKAILFFLFFIGLHNCIKAQNACIPPTCTNCMQVTLRNFTKCTLNFYWIYNAYSCSGNTGAATIAPGGSQTITGPCVSFCGEPCECPAGLWLEDPSTPGTLMSPWGVFTTWSGGPVTYWNLGSCTISPCTGPMKAVVTLTGANTGVIDFECY